MFGCRRTGSGADSVSLIEARACLSDVDLWSILTGKPSSLKHIGDFLS